MATQVVWKQVKSAFGGSLHYAYLGKWHVGSVVWNAMRQKGNTEQLWRIGIELPGIKANQVFFKELETAKTAVEKVVSVWVGGIL